jgi:hypothetical protein
MYISIGRIANLEAALAAKQELLEVFSVDCYIQNASELYEIYISSNTPAEMIKLCAILMRGFQSGYICALKRSLEYLGSI